MCSVAIGYAWAIDATEIVMTIAINTQSAILHAALVLLPSAGQTVRITPAAVHLTTFDLIGSKYSECTKETLTNFLESVMKTIAISLWLGWMKTQCGIYTPTPDPIG